MNMYYSFYMNEKMLLDNWTDYKECNWLLTNLLCKDDRKTIEQKLDFYFDNRKEKEDNQWWYYDESDKDFKAAYEDYKYRRDMYEDYLEYGEGNDVIAFVPFERNRIFEMYEDDLNKQDENREAVFVKKTARNKRMGTKLREINEVIIYKSDFDAITKAKRKYGLTEHQTAILFGLIFFSRMNQVRWCRIGTAYKLKSFKSCFNKTITEKDMAKIKETGLITSLKLEKGKAYNQLREQADYLHIETEVDYVYENFDNQDEVAYVFKTDKENNKLDLSALAKEVIKDYKVKYCSVCGKEFKPNSNRQHMCESCKQNVQREQARLRKQKQRKKDRE